MEKLWSLRNLHPLYPISEVRMCQSLMWSKPVDKLALSRRHFVKFIFRNHLVARNEPWVWYGKKQSTIVLLVFRIFPSWFRARWSMIPFALKIVGCFKTSLTAWIQEINSPNFFGLLFPYNHCLTMYKHANWQLLGKFQNALFRYLS